VINKIELSKSTLQLPEWQLARITPAWPRCQNRVIVRIELATRRASDLRQSQAIMEQLLIVHWSFRHVRQRAGTYNVTRRIAPRPKPGTNPISISTGSADCRMGELQAPRHSLCGTVS
jgi:hypothetical protein